MNRWLIAAAHGLGQLPLGEAPHELLVQRELLGVRALRRPSGAPPYSIRWLGHTAIQRAAAHLVQVTEQSSAVGPPPAICCNCSLERIRTVSLLSESFLECVRFVVMRISSQGSMARLATTAIAIAISVSDIAERLLRVKAI